MNTRRPENAAMDNAETRVLPPDAEPQLLPDPPAVAPANLSIDANGIAEAGEPVQIGLTGKSGGRGRTLALNTAIVALSADHWRRRGIGLYPRIY
jgi:hypothetical protein